MMLRSYRAALGTAAIVVVVAATLLGIAASGWIDKPFPGFFVLGNRVIPSIGLPAWSGSRDGGLYQHTVAAIEGQPVAEAVDVYRYVEQWPVGTALTYELRAAARTEARTIPSQRFSQSDYWMIFGSYLGTGLLYLLLGLLSAWCLPGLPVGRALFAVGTVGGIYALSAVGIYGPTFHLRLHALAEAVFPAALAYLAFVFPHDRPAITKPGLAVACSLSAALSIPYQLLVTQPGAYSTMHAACETYLGIVGLLLTGNLIIRCTTAAPATVLLRMATVGALLGLGVPTVVILMSGLTGGKLPVNVLTTTAFLFPLCLVCALVRERLVDKRSSMPPGTRPSLEALASHQA
jgi:hypothetical protein